MVTKGSVRPKSAKIFMKVIELRKKGFSYTEIGKETGIAKSTINNWLSLAGLTLTMEHLRIQKTKRIENHVLGTEAAKISRARRKGEDIQQFIQSMRKYFDDPFFVAGIMLYQAEGSKRTDCKFSNSDYRLILIFIRFIEKYTRLKRDENMIFELYIHETRKSDLERIKRFWSRKTGVSIDMFRVYWKKNIVVGRKENMDYVGQVIVGVRGEKVFGSKLLAISDIILRQYLR